MVVGHTQTVTGKIQTLCNGRFVMIDTAMSRNGYPECWLNEHPQAPCKASLAYLEIWPEKGEHYAVQYEFSQFKDADPAGNGFVKGQPGRTFRSKREKLPSVVAVAEGVDRDEEALSDSPSTFHDEF